jgi:hypothetical protein
MECHACGRTVDSADRFCNGCGVALQVEPDATTRAERSAVVEGAADQAGGDGETPEPDQSDVGLASTALADGNGDSDDGDGDRDSDDGDADDGDADDGDAEHNSDEGSTDTDSLPLTELVAATGGELPEDDPSWAPTGSVPATATTTTATDELQTTDLPATEPITEVWMNTVADADPAPPTPYDFVENEPVAVTSQVDTQVAATATMPAVPTAPLEDHSHFRFNLTLFIALSTGIVSLVGLFANVITITSDVRLVRTDDAPAAFRTGTWIVDDLADNISIAGLIAVLAMAIGGVASGFRWRWGSGLAGGAGLAMAGLAALTVGLAQFPIDIARAFARVPTEDPFVLTITRDLGYWLLIAAGALGIVLFFASINDAMGDRRPGLNPWIAALGALAVVVAAAGPLLPENQAIFSDNWYLIEGPGQASAMLLVARLVQLGLFVLGGVVGFLSVRRWGLGLAVGSTLPSIWLVVSTLFEITDNPIGLGWQNRGAVDMHVHGVTIIGISAVLAMLLLAVIGAYDQSVRERR